jgi:uncharacterized coiled-coil protein SlyX
MSVATHEVRITTLETRMSTVEENLEALTNTTYTMHRRITKVELNIDKLMEHFGVASATDTDVDEALDGQ